MRLLKLSLLVGFGLAGYGALQPSSFAQKEIKPSQGSFEQVVKPFLAETCVLCHNSKSKSGGLNLEIFQDAASVMQNREVWEHVLIRLQTGQMPPKGIPRPEQSRIESITRWIEQEFARADRLVKPDPGRVTARRLNRTEYNNTVRDLLGVDIEPANDFPQDDSAHGFDNISDALSLSPTLMERYMAAAEKVARLAVFGPEGTIETFRIEPTRPRRLESTTVKRITASLASNQYRFSSLALEIARSMPFQQRTEERTVGQSTAAALPIWHRMIVRNVNEAAASSK